MNKVFVYGSLLRGEGNHKLLRNSELLGETTTPEGFGIIDLGWFPGAIRTEKGKVVGEVYEVDDETLNRLDSLEGYNRRDPLEGLYNRIEIDTEYGTAYMYLYNDRFMIRHMPTIEEGNWKKHLRKYEKIR
jgi:gamma-glutamylcyclotransferase (GGCT)/AIG2-like uncharacterized protein YtfP